MKRIVKDVKCYYLNRQGTDNSGKCDDLEGNSHVFTMFDISDFEEFQGNFILDLDLDFFTKTVYYTRLYTLNLRRQYQEILGTY